MTTTITQRVRRLATDAGPADLAQKGQPVSSHVAREIIRNTNYAAQQKVAGCLMGGCGHTNDYGEGIAAQYRSNRVWSGTTLGPRGHTLIWEPHATNLTIGYAFRAEDTGGIGVVDIYVCDTAWTSAVPPTPSKYMKKPVALNAAGSYFNGGVGEINGEYTGTIVVTFPTPADHTYHVYFDLTSVLVMGSWCVWVDPGTP